MIIFLKIEFFQKLKSKVYIFFELKSLILLYYRYKWSEKIIL